MGAAQGRPPGSGEGEEQVETERQTLQFSIGDPQDVTSTTTDTDEDSNVAVFVETSETSYMRSESAPTTTGGSSLHLMMAVTHTERSVSVEEGGGGGRGGEWREEVVMTLSQRYPYTVRDKILSGPPSSFQRGRRRSSGFLNFVGKRLGGNFLYEPEDMMRDDDGGNVVDGPGTGEDGGRGGGGGGGDVGLRCRLSSLAQNTLRKIFNGIDPEEVVDYHVHLVGHGDSGSGCYLHDSTKTWRYPLRRIKTAVFMAAAQTPDMEGGDLQYISRLIRLAKHFLPAAVLNPNKSGYRSGTLCLLPFDKFYEKNGREDMTKTTMYIPNEYAARMAVDFPDIFVPFGSVNPYRHDAIEELERCAQFGVTVIKWLPNSMGIDPSDEECVPFYLKMKELEMALLVHTGDEHAVNAAYINNRLGNPLLLRKPLDCGVKVIGAHCATEGMSADLDNGGASVPSFSLFLRLMREEKYRGLLFGDISATCAFKRLPYLKLLLQATDIHNRLVYGSDYPVPAINLVVHTSRLVRQGFVTQEEGVVLNELYNYNPLLFDFACKRLVKGPAGEQFPAEVFKAHPLLPPFRHESRLLGTPVDP